MDIIDFSQTFTDYKGEPYMIGNIINTKSASSADSLLEAYKKYLQKDKKRVQSKKRS